MKITDVKTWVVGNPPPGLGGKYFIFVRLTTDSGVVGYGDASLGSVATSMCPRARAGVLPRRYRVQRDASDAFPGVS